MECGGCLSSKDVDSLRELMGCVVRNALLPHVEKQIYILNDLVCISVLVEVLKVHVAERKKALHTIKA